MTQGAQIALLDRLKQRGSVDPRRIERGQEIVDLGRLRFITATPQDIVGEVVDELGFLDGRPRSASAVALEPTVTQALRREDFIGRLEACPRLAMHLLEILAARLRYTTTYAEGLAFLDVNGRVAARLLELADRFGARSPDGCGQEFDLHLTQAELASWVASSRESVNKVLTGFREQGLIELAGQKITVLDRRGLWRKVAY